jgi:protein-disulfide isomerase
VEFSDFQCPYCKAATATIAQVAPRYRDRVRWVFRDFPIANLHPDAPLAHEAARCAAEQDKFWAYHDVLFEEAPSLAPARLGQYATRVGLDPAAFAACLDSHRHRAAVERDIDAGRHLGVSGTPTFFVNGRPLVGNPSPGAFEALIEQELARATGK